MSIIIVGLLGRTLELLFILFQLRALFYLLLVGLVCVLLLLPLGHLIHSLLNLQLLFDSPKLCELPPINLLNEIFGACMLVDLITKRRPRLLLE